MPEENKELETANVLASVAHDLRSPLNAVIGFSRIMLKGIDGPLSEMQAADLEAVYTNGNTMLEMVDNLIDLAKAEAGWLQPSLKEVHLGALLEKTVSLASSAAKAKEIELAYTPGEDVPPVQVDEGQVQKAIERLIAAAIKMVGSGTITLAAAPDGERVRIHLTGANPGGLSPEVTHSIEAFRTAGTSDDYRIDATALLLLVSKHLLRINKGSLEIEAVTETELRLTLDLPLSL